MHFQRQKLMAVTEYLAPRPAVPPCCRPPRREALEEEEEEVIPWPVAVVGVRLRGLRVRGDRAALHAPWACFAPGA